MRRSRYVCALFVGSLLSSAPDAAYVPATRQPMTAATSTPRVSVPTTRIAPVSPGARIVSRARPARVVTDAAPLVPMQTSVGRTATTTALIVAPNPSSLGALVTLTATVAVVLPASGTPTGLVRFRANGNVIGSATVAPSGLAVFTTGLAIAGASTLTANYVGDTTFGPSTSDPVPHLTSAAAASTVTVVAASPTPSAAGAAVTVLAVVFPLAGGVPTGTVQFFDIWRKQTSHE